MSLEHVLHCLVKRIKIGRCRRLILVMNQIGKALVVPLGHAQESHGLFAQLSGYRSNMAITILERVDKKAFV